MINFKTLTLEIKISDQFIRKTKNFFIKYQLMILGSSLSGLSFFYFIFFLQNGLGLAYNDARSHLDIGRRVVEGLKPGLAQLGSVWLPLNHVLMMPFVWNDFLWHSGLAGAITSMVSYVATGFLIYQTLKLLGVGVWGRAMGVLVFALNLNILYLQSTAMTELLLLATSTAGSYYLMKWSKTDQVFDLVASAFFIFLAVLTRYDGWFLLIVAACLILVKALVKKGYQKAEGLFILFCTLSGFGIVLWFGWNLLIFKDALYFAFGPYSAHVQQQELSAANNLATKGNFLLSAQIYFYSLFYNIGAFNAVLGFAGMIVLWLDKKVSASIRLMSASLVAPLIFNIIALVLGFSVLFIQGLSGNTWFNVRYGVMVMPLMAICIGYLIDRVSSLKYALVGLIALTLFFSFTSFDAVTIDDARVGSSQKNVTEVSGWLKQNAKEKEGFILISAASHDAIIFSSGLPMSRFIHEGTGKYWTSALDGPEHWARWVIMRTHDENDQTWKAVSKAPGFADYQLVGKYPFADIYQLKDQYLGGLNTTPVLGKQK